MYFISLDEVHNKISDIILRNMLCMIKIIVVYGMLEFMLVYIIKGTFINKCLFNLRSSLRKIVSDVEINLFFLFKVLIPANL